MTVLPKKIYGPHNLSASYLDYDLSLAWHQLYLITEALSLANVINFVNGMSLLANNFTIHYLLSQLFDLVHLYSPWNEWQLRFHLDNSHTCSAPFELLHKCSHLLLIHEEHNHSLAECVTQAWEVSGLSFTGGTAFCPLARHFIFWFVLVQLRNNHPNMTDFFWLVRLESNQTNNYY